MTLKIPATFIQSRSRLTWREVQVGLETGWLTDEAAIDLAIDHVTRGDDSRDVLELASVLSHEKYKTAEIVHRLAERDPGFSSDKWLFLLLAWLYENRYAVEDPLGVVEDLYADFGYPKAIATIVRYMPPQDPLRVGEQYLFDAWRDYLDVAGRNYAPTG